MQFLAVCLVIFAIHILDECLPRRSSTNRIYGRSILPEARTVGSKFVSPLLDRTSSNGIVIRDMSWTLSKLAPRSAPVVLLLLIFSAAVGFAAVGHLVARFNANQQSRGRKLYAQGMAAAAAARYDDAIAAFRAALTC